MSPFTPVKLNITEGSCAGGHVPARVEGGNTWVLLGPEA